MNFKDVISELAPPIDPGDWPSEWGVADKLWQNNSDLYDFFSEVFIGSKMTSGSLNLRYDIGDTVGIMNLTASAQLGFEGLLEDYEEFMNQSVPFFGEWWWNQNVSIVEAHLLIESAPNYSIISGYQKYGGGYSAIEYFINNIDEDWIRSLDRGQIDFWYALYPLNFNNTVRSLDISLSNFYYEGRKIDDKGVYEMLSGVLINPSKHMVNASWYDLNCLFEAEEASYPSRSDQQLGITVSGGSNGTHHTILSYEGATPPNSVVYDGAGNAVAMFWNNKTIPDLKDLRFSVASGDMTGVYVHPGYMPILINAPMLGVTLTIENISDPTGLLISEASEVPAPGPDLAPVGYYVNITAPESITSLDAWLTFRYTDAQAAGFDESTLNIYWLNPSTNAYEPLSEVIRNPG